MQHEEQPDEGALLQIQQEVGNPAVIGKIVDAAGHRRRAGKSDQLEAGKRNGDQARRDERLCLIGAPVKDDVGSGDHADSQISGPESRESCAAAAVQLTFCEGRPQYQS